MKKAGRARPGVGEFLRYARLRAGLSQRELCTRIGRSPAYVSKLEADLIEPSFEAVATAAVALGLSALETWVLVRVAALDRNDRHTHLPTSEPQ